MRTHGVTTCTASPPFFDRLAAEVERTGQQPALRRILTGGAPVSDAQLAAWRRVLPDTEILVVYGSTEAEPVAHLTAEEGSGRDQRAPRLLRRAPERAGADAGDPHRGGAGRVGRERVGGVGAAARRDRRAGGRGRARLPGLLPQPESRAREQDRRADGSRLAPHGRHRLLRRQGRFWIAGRVHSTIRRGETLVHPQLVEQAARGADPRIRRVAAVGLPDPELGERVVLVVETEVGRSSRRDRSPARRGGA